MNNAKVRVELEAEKARVQDLCAMILDGRETREDEPVRTVTATRFMKALDKARKHFALNGNDNHD